MKQILVFGGTGGTGREVIKQALDKKYEVTAVLRDPAGFQFQHSNLKIVRGDVLQPATFSDCIRGQDAVISCLGTGTGTKQTRVYSGGIQNIIAAMKNEGVTRLLCISAIALDTNKEMGFIIRFASRYILQKILSEPYSDMRLMEATVEQSSLNWTILRPPRLTDRIPKGTYRVAVNSHLRRPFFISRADLAHYMLSDIDDTRSFNAKVEIAY